MLRDGLVWRLVLTADSQPNVAFVPLYQPAVPSHLGRQVEQQQGGEQEEEPADSGRHGVQEDFLILPQQGKEGGRQAGLSVRSVQGQDRVRQAESLMETRVSSGLSSR